MRKKFVYYAILALCVVAASAYFWPPILWTLFVIVPLILCGIYDMLQTKHTLWRNFPLIGRGRWVMEILRPPIHQYFIESNTDGTPINRMFRSSEGLKRIPVFIPIRFIPVFQRRWA